MYWCCWDIHDLSVKIFCEEKKIPMRNTHLHTALRNR